MMRVPLYTETCPGEFHSCSPFPEYPAWSLAYQTKKKNKRKKIKRSRGNKSGIKKEQRRGEKGENIQSIWMCLESYQ